MKKREATDSDASRRFSSRESRVQKASAFIDPAILELAKGNGKGSKTVDEMLELMAKEIMRQRDLLNAMQAAKS